MDRLGEMIDDSDDASDDQIIEGDSLAELPPEYIVNIMWPTFSYFTNTLVVYMIFD